MKIITEAQVEQYLTLPECITAMREAMIAVSSGETVLPIRQFMPIPDTQGKMAIMPGAIESPACFGIKLVCKYVREPDSPLGTHVGMVLIFDSEKGMPLAMIEGASLTAIRTSAASAMATDILANDAVDTLLVMGGGEQAKRHIRSMLAVRNPNSILVWGRTMDRIEPFAREMSEETGRTVTAVTDAETAARASDLICTTTASKTPILLGAWVQPGAHVNLVGAAIPTSAEIDSDLVAKSRYVVDYRPAAMAAAGELLNAIKETRIEASHIAGEIGEIAAGNVPGRTRPDDITVYKSLGVSAQDMSAGYTLYSKAVEVGFGLDIELLDHPTTS